MPAENGLPQYVSKHARTGLYQYYRRPPTGVKGAAFWRSFGSKDRKVVSRDYSRIHAEAETYFDRLVTGRALNDQELFRLAMTHDNLDTLFKQYAGRLSTAEDWNTFITVHGSEQIKELSVPDRDRLIAMLRSLYAATETLHLEVARIDLADQEERFTERFGSPPPSLGSFTLRDAYDQAWKPAKVRGKNTVTEVGRYVDEFMALNGTLDLRDYTREHWAAWRKDCLDRHGPGPTAFKRFSMMKTICNETIRAGLGGLKRANFEGADVSMRKIKSKKLRNEGWLHDELKTWFGSDYFKSPKSDADYWVAVIIALTGARLSEVTGMKVPDVDERHGMWTFFFAKETGKTEDSRRIVPIPQQIIDLGFMKFLKTRPKTGPLFENTTAKKSSQTYSRWRADLELTRKGCDMHAFRHNIKTLLEDLGAPDRTNNYITGHAAVGEGGRYGKTLYSNCLEYLNKVDLGVKIPKWKGAQ